MEDISIDNIGLADPMPMVHLDLELLRDSHLNRPYVHRRGRFADKHWMSW